MSEGTPNWFHNVSNLGALLVLLESPRQVRFNEGDLETFRPEVQEILNLE
jgi:hypothetical protein